VHEMHRRPDRHQGIVLSLPEGSTMMLLPQNLSWLLELSAATLDNKLPEKGKPRLRCPGDQGSMTVQSVAVTNRSTP
jgi:hypothetical protein